MFSFWRIHDCDETDWEYFREMNDVRNDVGTAFSRKNPFEFRNAFASLAKPYTKNEWHKLQLVQNDGTIRGAIDGVTVLEINDNSWSNTGCVLNYGHIAIRCMVHSKMLFRNLKVYTERLPFSEALAGHLRLRCLRRSELWLGDGSGKHKRGSSSSLAKALSVIQRDPGQRVNHLAHCERRETGD